MRWFLALALAIGGGASLGRAAAAGPTGSAVAVTIDVIVDDARGRAVDTLGPSDFSVTEQAVPLKIDEVRFVRANGASSGAAPPLAPRPGELPAVADSGRLFAIFLDEFHVAPGPGADRVCDALIRFVKDDLGPEDLVVVLKPLDSLLDIRLSSDREAAVRAIQSFLPRQGNYEPRTDFERTFIAGAPAAIESTRAQIVASSLDAMVNELGRFAPARKTLIVVSEGFARRPRRRGDEMLPSLESVVQIANRAHTAIYPIQPLANDSTNASTPGAGNVATTDRLGSALKSLADETAGREIGPAKDPAVGLTEALSDASGYYLLTLSSASESRDGRFHPVNVNVGRPGLTVRARKGYWAPSAVDMEVRSAAARAAESLSGWSATPMMRHASPLIRPWFGMSRAADGSTEVNFVWEPTPPVPGDRTRALPPAQIVMTVTGTDGRAVFEGVVLPSDTVALDPAEARRAHASFETPAARLLVQMTIEDLSSHVVDRDVRDLIVGGFKGPIAIGSSEILAARNAREYRNLTSNPDAIPVARRQFSRTERLLVRVPVSTTGGAGAELSARLVSGMGSAIRQLTAVPASFDRSQYQIDLPLAGLASGAYTLELTARTSGDQARDSVSFVVTP